MKEIFLNGRLMSDKESLHLYLKERLFLPDYYGRNLDALWDILSTEDREMKIILVYKADFIGQMGSYGQSLIDLLQEAADENPKISLEIRG